MLAQITILFDWKKKPLINPSPAFANSVDPDQLASEEAN